MSMKRRWSRSGQALVEFSMIAPILFLALAASVAVMAITVRLIFFSTLVMRDLENGARSRDYRYSQPIEGVYPGNYLVNFQGRRVADATGMELTWVEWLFRTNGACIRVRDGFFSFRFVHYQTYPGTPASSKCFERPSFTLQPSTPPPAAISSSEVSNADPEANHPVAGMGGFDSHQAASPDDAEVDAYADAGGKPKPDIQAADAHPESHAHPNAATASNAIRNRRSA